MDKPVFPKDAFKRLLKIGLIEDLGQIKSNNFGDVTSLACIPSMQEGFAKIIAKQDGVVCGLPIVELVLQELQANYKVNFLVQEGNIICKGQEILTLKSSTQNLLVAERTILNFLQNLSGIATFTHTFTKTLEGTRIQVLDTRKILAGYRRLHKYAVLLGGGVNHRFGLYDQILLKENHLAILGNDINLAIQKSLDYSQGRLKIEVEIQNQDQLESIQNQNIHQIMLDNMNVSQMQIAITWIRKNLPQTKIEASGNFSIENISKIKVLDLDFVSIGAITHSAPSFDFSMLIDL